MNAVKSLIRSIFNKNTPTLIKPLVIRKSEHSILREIVITSKLDIENAIAQTRKWSTAEKQIKEFFANAMVISDAIYLPTKIEIIRVILKKQTNKLTVEHIDHAPSGSPKEFVININVSRR